MGLEEIEIWKSCLLQAEIARLEHRCSFNADESGLIRNMLPNQSLVLRGVNPQMV